MTEMENKILKIISEMHSGNQAEALKIAKAIIESFPQITKKPVSLQLVDDGEFSDSGCNLKLYKPFYCTLDAHEWAKDYYVEVVE